MSRCWLASILNDLAVSLQEAPREPVADRAAIEALSIVYGHRPETADELVRFLTAANLLNAYVKQDRRHIRFGYEFKDGLVPVARDVAAGLYRGAKTYTFLDETGLPVTFFRVGELQYSFHRLPFGDALPQGPGVERMAFDGIRKQHCAALLLSAASTMALVA